MIRTLSKNWHSEINRKSVEISASNIIDWSDSNTFYKYININTTFTFSNQKDGQSICLTVKNNSASSVSISLPAYIKKTTDLDLLVQSSKYNVYTFININNDIFVSSISGML